MTAKSDLVAALDRWASEAPDRSWFKSRDTVRLYDAGRAYTFDTLRAAADFARGAIR